ncbi:CDT1 Geminin-binding domain-like protein [Artemisia annua]|uniref:CDT1 Geminin-binding domain-like protein n=1 Tax=Artemisia annua TaxID=35608 RepID=A0A2U1N3U2_ARTAN|nr:CDT1 Geminin-binding domain-like protein [Artemisia annua]
MASVDQKIHEGEQTVMESSHKSNLPMADKSCPVSSTPVKKLQIHESQRLDAHFVSPTPEKTEETLNSRVNKELAELPEKYKSLSELFDRMTTSLRLLGLRKQLPTFRNICRQVETLTGRKFSYKNLAQIKFILPEAVQTEKILLHNKKTLSVEHDIKVTLNFDVVEGHIENSAYIALSHTFSNRLFKLVNKHSEGFDVPEAELPEPFNQREITVSVPALPEESSTETLPNIAEAELLNPSHMPPSFKKRFSTKVVEDSAKTELLSSPVLPSIKSDTTTDKDTSVSSSLDSVKHEKPLQVVNAETPMKIRLIPREISVETPDLSTPKRSVPTEDKKLKSVLSQKAMTNSSFTKRSLNFLNDDDGELLEGKTTSAGDSSAKVEDTSENDVIAQSGLKAFQPTSDCLTDIVETIHNVSRSTQCSFITQSELVYKILVNNLDIVEREEIEEHLEALVNKAPDWITKKVDLSGDTLYYFNKGMDLKSVTEMLT